MDAIASRSLIGGNSPARAPGTAEQPPVNEELTRRFSAEGTRTRTASITFVESLTEAERDEKVWTNLGEKVGLFTYREVGEYSKMRVAMEDRLQALGERSGTKDHREFLAHPETQEWLSVMDDFQKHKPGSAERVTAYLGKSTGPRDHITLSSDAEALLSAVLGGHPAVSTSEQVALQLLGGNSKGSGKPGEYLDKSI